MEDDLALLTAWRGGDARAGEVLFERHFDAVFRFMRTKVATGAEDLVQAAFLACVEGRDRLREGASFRTYLFTAARNIVAEYWRKRSREPVALDEVSAHDLGPSPPSVLALKVEERLLVEALRRLPLDRQIALELYYVEGLRTREIAEILGLGHSTVRSRVRRALAQLRTIVEELAESSEDYSTTMNRLDAWAAELRDS